MSASPRTVAVLGGNRIPFARSNGAYATASNQDMLTAALDGLIDRFGLDGERLGEVAAGAVLKHSRDFNLTRECVLGSRLAPETPAYDVQQACGTGLEAAILVANKIALGQIDVGMAGGVDTTSDAPLALNEDLRAVLLEANRAKSTAGQAARAARAAARDSSCPRSRATRSRAPACRWASTARTAAAVEDRPRGAGRARRRAATRTSPPPTSAASWTTCITPYLGLERDQNLRPDSTAEKLAKLKPVFGGPDGTMTAGNSTPLSDGAAVALLRQRGVGSAPTTCRCSPTSSRPRPPPSTTSTGARGC